MTRYLLLMTLCAVALAGCGYRGDLYLPKKDDNTQFGPVQTGLSIDPIDPAQLPDHDADQAPQPKQAPTKQEPKHE